MVSSYMSVSMAALLSVTQGTVRPASWFQSFECHAGCAHGGKCTITVPWLEVDGPDCLLEHTGFEAEPGGIERCIADAVVGREPDDDRVANAGLAEEAGKLRLLLAAIVG